MTRGGSKQHQNGARRCLVEGEVAEKALLIRFVLSPDDVVTPDIAERLTGRGVWVSAKHQAVKKASETGAFARGFKKKVSVPENLVPLVERQLTDRVISLISLARKSGQALSGAEKVAKALGDGQVTLLLQAIDGSEREKRNLAFRNEADIRLECLDRNELGMAFSRENVVHAALTGEGLTNRVKEEAIRLTSFRENANQICKG